MNLYICVYRQPIPKSGDLKSALREASSNEALQEYLHRYDNRFKETRDGFGYFYDWGDDPSFFAEERFGGSVTWGACRSNVRKVLNPEDVVIFFCAQQQRNKVQWKYYYVGLGTVAEVIKCREQLWKESSYKPYRQFFNLLVDSKGIHRELITCHTDWADRLEAPYIIFDKDPAKTHFNVTNPLHVATCNSRDEARRRKEEGKTMEIWRSSRDERVKRIYNLVPKREGRKKLLTSETGFGHVFMNLRETLKRNSLNLRNKRLSKEQLDDALEKKRWSFLEVSTQVAGESKS